MHIVFCMQYMQHAHFNTLFAVGCGPGVFWAIRMHAFNAMCPCCLAPYCRPRPRCGLKVPCECMCCEYALAATLSTVGRGPGVLRRLWLSPGCRPGGRNRNRQGKGDRWWVFCPEDVWLWWQRVVTKAEGGRRAWCGVRGCWHACLTPLRHKNTLQPASPAFSHLGLAAGCYLPFQPPLPLHESPLLMRAVCVFPGTLLPRRRAVRLVVHPPAISHLLELGLGRAGGTRG